MAQMWMNWLTLIANAIGALVLLGVGVGFLGAAETMITFLAGILLAIAAVTGLTQLGR